MKKDLRFAAWPVAILCIAIGIGGIVSPDGGTALRRFYYATPGLFYALIAVRNAMGLGLFLAAPSSRWPRILTALATVMCLQALSAALLGPDRARTVMEWENAQGTAVLRAGAAVALASGCFLIFAVSKRPSET